MKQLVKLSLLCCVAFCAACSNRHSVEKALDGYFSSLDGHFMGSVEVQKDGRTIYHTTIGYADIENNIPATSETLYRIGSITTTFTAVLVLKAAAEGRLSLDDTLEKYFPDAHIPNASQITIDQLLRHRSGLRDITNDRPEDFMTYHTEAQTRQQMVERIANAGTNFPPDSEYRYSNDGYILLTYILEDVFGKPYAHLVDEQIIRPLALKQTRYTDLINPQGGDARSYFLMDDWVLAPETNASIAVGAGALISTPTDLAKFGTALFNDYFGSGILEQMEEMKDGYGRGLTTFPNGERICYGHIGAIDGYWGLLASFDDIVITICTNGIDRSIDVTGQIIDLVNGLDIE